ncbi:uncharacterized protein LOC107041637 [Diachasma alloeum]|uniref:uncharacterized protein LOC107041637 n=1 Tax=Diachasma alloeum TaxID=454923 RepID=UPI0010FB2C19|nr:uncharacterized protein LOC107041637 [Diachasma alloeum]
MTNNIRDTHKDMQRSFAILRDNIKQLKSTPIQDVRDGMKRFGMPPQVGFRRLSAESNAIIHLGQWIWLLRKQYIDAKRYPKTGSQFVKNLALAVFGDELRLKSVTGKKGPRALESKPALPSNAVRAIRVL